MTGIGRKPASQWQLPIRTGLVGLERLVMVAFRPLKWPILVYLERLEMTQTSR
jgi:hypothetical protein